MAGGVQCAGQQDRRWKGGGSAKAMERRRRHVQRARFAWPPHLSARKWMRSVHAPHPFTSNCSSPFLQIHF